MLMPNGQPERTKNGVVAYRENYGRRGVLGVRRSPLASGQCLTLPASSGLIRLAFEQGLCALRVCGKECCFSSHSGQVEVGKLVLLSLAVQESDNLFLTFLRPQIYSSQSLPYIPKIPSTLHPVNLQHLFSLLASLFLLPLATLICTQEHLFIHTKFSSLLPLPEGRFFI